MSGSAHAEAVREAVEAAHDAGLAVVPGSMDKVPKVKWKHWQSTAQTAEEYEKLGHGSLWAVVTGERSGIVVLDFDFEAGGEQSLRDLGLEDAVTVRTPGGAHVYVRHPGHPVKTNARAFPDLRGLDVRGDGGLAWFAGRSRKGVYTPVDWPPTPWRIAESTAAELFPHPQATADRAPRAEWTGRGSGSPEAVRYVVRAGNDIRNAEPGTSNAELNRAGYAVGGLIAAGQLDAEWATEELLAAAEDRGAGDPETVLRAALEAGADSPWRFTPDEDEWVPVAALKLMRRSGVPEPTPFPVDALPPPLDEFVVAGAKAVSCPVDYLGAGLLPVLGTAVGGFTSLEITETWHESTLLYTALVGPPSARKTPAMKLLLAPVYEAERTLFEVARSEASDDEWKEVDAERLLVDDATVEALFGVLQRNPRGVILAPDELAGWVKGMGQYKGGLGRDRQHWLSIWSRRPIRTDRKQAGNNYIPDPFVAVLGGIQPEPLEELLHGKDDGLLPRMLMAQGERVTPRLRRGAIDPGLLGRYKDIWNGLRDNGITHRVVQFTPAGYEAFERWTDDHYDTLVRLPDELAGAWGKMDAQAARIALVLACVDQTDVTPDIVDRAIGLVRYFQGQAGGILQGSSSGSPWEKLNAGRIKAVATFLSEHPEATRADLMVFGPEWAMDVRTMDRILDTLAEIGIWNG